MSKDRLRRVMGIAASPRALPVADDCDDDGAALCDMVVGDPFQLRVRLRLEDEVTMAVLVFVNVALRTKTTKSMDGSRNWSDENPSGRRRKKGTDGRGMAMCSIVGRTPFLRLTVSP